MGLCFEEVKARLAAVELATSTGGGISRHRHSSKMEGIVQTTLRLGMSGTTAAEHL